MPTLLERIEALFQLYNRNSLSKGLEFIFETVIPNVSLLAFAWLLFVIIVPGFLILVLLDQSIDQKDKYDFLETFCLSGALGICFLAQIGHILDIFYRITLLSVSASIVVLGLVTLIIKRETLIKLLKSQTIDVRVLMGLIPIIVLGTIIRLYDNYPYQIITTLGLPYKDPNAHFYWSQIVADSGHALIDPLTPNVYPNGFFYIIGTIFLSNNTIQNYYLTWLFLPFLIAILGTLSIYISSLRLNKDRMAALYSSLIFTSSWLILWRTRSLLSDNMGLIIIPLMFYLIFDRKKIGLFAFLYGSLFIMNPVPALWVSVALVIYCLIILVTRYYTKRSLSEVLKLVWVAIPSVLLIMLFSAAQWLRIIPFIFGGSGGDGGGGGIKVTPSTCSIQFQLLKPYYGFDSGPIAVSLALFGVLVSIYKKSHRKFHFLSCFLVTTLFMAHFNIMIINWLCGHGKNRILIYNILALSILASTGGLELKNRISQYLETKTHKTFLTKKTVLSLFVVFLLLQQITIGVFNTKAFYYRHDFRNDEMRALFWLEQNTETDVTIVEYHDHQVGRLDVSWFLYPRHVLKDGFIGFYHLTTPEEILIWVETHQIDYVLLRIENMPDFYLQFHEIINQMSEFEMVFQDGAILVYQFNK